ncbi:uncharacterized protein LOC112045513 [Bicyclus anynana]|uniref:Uncharacterized protein LOC112045513 n=1 Tax=Bicyclus anynana TaxID=110368 RepID=A0A6J1MX51_BICAN|nr:uncharacterized protein LOC112045513 [Bicyclus anynana]
MWFSKPNITVLILIVHVVWTKCDGQVGPDPWDYVSTVNSAKQDDIPPDLVNVPTKKVQTNTIGKSEWFYKRILAIVLKGGLVKKNEDGSVDISLQMRYSPEHWNTLEEYITSNNALSEDMYRRSMGYVEEAIYKPTITEKIVMAWTEYIQIYLIDYKLYIIWTISILAIIGLTNWLVRHLSQKHILTLLFAVFYMYEVFVSYKEAEKQELDRFIQAVNTCKWFIWSSTCEVPPPDPLIFLKHMNPLKICVRMFSVLLTELMLPISDTVKTISHGITDGLWFPFDKIMYGILMVIFNTPIILLFVMIIFNYFLNVPLNLNFLGIFNIGLKQRNRSIPKAFSNNNTPDIKRKESVDRISGETLKKFLNVFEKALVTTQSANTIKISNSSKLSSNLALTNKPTISRSASTGRLPNFSSNEKLNH